MARERDYYRSVLKRVRKSVQGLNVVVERPVNPIPEMHFSFDYAQQVKITTEHDNCYNRCTHFPSDPLQPGPIYFLTPRKCGVFGVCCEAIPEQVNYLIDECMDTGKGANTVISYLHHYLQNHGIRAHTINLSIWKQEPSE